MTTCIKKYDDDMNQYISELGTCLLNNGSNSVCYAQYIAKIQELNNIILTQDVISINECIKNSITQPQPSSSPQSSSIGAGWIIFIVVLVITLLYILYIMYIKYKEFIEEKNIIRKNLQQSSFIQNIITGRNDVEEDSGLTNDIINRTTNQREKRLIQNMQDVMLSEKIGIGETGIAGANRSSEKFQVEKPAMDSLIEISRDRNKSLNKEFIDKFLGEIYPITKSDYMLEINKQYNP